jgi:hypothetical protein
VVEQEHEYLSKAPGTPERPWADGSPADGPPEDPEKAAAAIREALGLSPEETTETVLQEIRLYREHVEELGKALGLERHASLRTMLARVKELQEGRPTPIGFFEHVAGEVGMPLSSTDDAVVHELHRRLEQLETLQQLTAGEVADRVMTMEEVVQARARRHAALSDVMALWGQHRLGEEPALEDIMGLSAWLADGDTAPMEAAIRVRAAFYTQQPANTIDVDAARWTPDETAVAVSDAAARAAVRDQGGPR